MPQNMLDSVKIFNKDWETLRCSSSRSSDCSGSAPKTADKSLSIGSTDRDNESSPRIIKVNSSLDWCLSVLAIAAIYLMQSSSFKVRLFPLSFDFCLLLLFNPSINDFVMGTDEGVLLHVLKALEGNEQLQTLLKHLDQMFTCNYFYTTVVKFLHSKVLFLLKSHWQDLTWKNMHQENTHLTYSTWKSSETRAGIGTTRCWHF